MGEMQVVLTIGFSQLFDNGANCLGMTMYTLKSPMLTLNVDIATC